MIMKNKKMTTADQANATMNRIDSELDVLSGKSKGATALFYKMSEELHEINDALGVKLNEIEALESRLCIQKEIAQAQIEENNKTLQKIHEIIGYGD